MKRVGKATILESALDDSVPKRVVGKTRTLYRKHNGHAYYFKSLVTTWWVHPSNVQFIKGDGPLDNPS